MMPRDAEDSYLASLSDLIIGVLFVFIILLMAFALNYRVAQTDADVKQQELTKRNQQLSDAHNERKELLERVQKTLRDKGIPVEIDINNGVLRLPESLLFDSGKAELRDTGVEALRIVAQNLSQILPCYATSKSPSIKCVATEKKARRLEAIFIEGHTDNVPIHNVSFKDNWDLSVARAKGTYLALTKGAPELEQMENERAQPLLSFSAYAERRPIVPNDSDNGRRKNRRIDLRFIMAVPKAMTTINETKAFISR
jgi:chemotaxis protein MotB